MPVRLQFVPGDAPDLLDLPWSTPLADWDHPRLIKMARGASRHVVRFVRGNHDDERVFALKETSEELARREYQMLRVMREEDLPVVDAVGIVTGRRLTTADDPDPGPTAVLITRYLDFSLPYRYLFTNAGGAERPGTGSRLMDAGVILMCRLHLEGFFWGDCSLNNLLFRRDAGALMAYLVDAETALHPTELSSGMRDHDIEIACENVVGGLLDLQAAGRLPADIDPVEIADRLRERYDELWAELTETEEFDPDDRHAIDRRIRRLNDLGFDIGELVVEQEDDGRRMRLRPELVEEGHHARELQHLTGLRVQENQARHLLNDIAAFGAWLEGSSGRASPLAVVAARWIAEVYEPLQAKVPGDLAAKREPPELFHEMLTHRYHLAEASGDEVTNEQALASLLDEVLVHNPDERVIADDTT